MERFQNATPQEMLELEWLAQEFRLFEKAWKQVKVINANKRKWNRGNDSQILK